LHFWENERERALSTYCLMMINVSKLWRAQILYFLLLKYGREDQRERGDDMKGLGFFSYEMQDIY
jgi:hypothetical protein